MESHWHEDWPRLVKSISVWLFFHKGVWVLHQNRRENNLSTPVPLLNMYKSPTDRDAQQPQAALPTEHLSPYWPEHGGGHLQYGWEQTYSRRCDPRWCKWQPGETASPLLCHYRAQERVHLAPVQNLHRAPRIAGITAGLMCRWIWPW